MECCAGSCSVGLRRLEILSVGLRDVDCCAGRCGLLRWEL